MKRKILIVILTILCLGFTFAACEKGTTAFLDIREENASVQAGSQIALTLSSEGLDGDVVWSSSIPSRATVSDKGVVTGILPGEVVISASCGELRDQCVVTVLESDGEDDPFPVLELSQETASLQVGGSLPIEAKVLLDGDEVSGATITFTSQNTDIVQVSDNGVLTGLKSGTGAVIVKAEYDGKIMEKTVWVTVVIDASIAVDKQSAQLYLSGENSSVSVTVTEKILNEAAYEGEISFSVKNGYPACVELAVSEDCVTITAKEVGETVVEAYFMVENTKISTEIAISVVKEQKELPSMIFNKLPDEDKMVVTEDVNTLELEGTFVGMYCNGNAVENIGTGNELAFSWEAVAPFIQSGKMTLTLETDVMVYRIDCEMNDFSDWTPISTFEDLNNIRNDASNYVISKNYYLTNDIDCAGEVYVPISDSLSGTFDGNGYAIRNFRYANTPNGGQAGAGNVGNIMGNGGTQDWTQNFGLFGGITSTGKLRNVVFDNLMAFTPGDADSSSENSYIKMGLVNYNDGLIENVVVWVNSVYEFYGITAKNGETGIIRNCIVDTNRRLDDKYGTTGSLAVCALANTNNGLIENCYSNAYTSNMVGWPGSDNVSTPLVKNGSGEQNNCKQVVGYNAVQMIEYLQTENVSAVLLNLAKKVYPADGEAIGYPITADGDTESLTVDSSARYMSQVLISFDEKLGMRAILTVFKTGDEAQTVEVVENTFRMPAFPVTVRLTYEESVFQTNIPEGKSITLDLNRPTEQGGVSTFQLDVVCDGQNVTEAAQFTSSEPEAVSVDKNGLITILTMNSGVTITIAYGDFSETLTVYGREWKAISDYEQLNSVRNDVGEDGSIKTNYYLTNDIDCTDEARFEPMACALDGIFDGNGYSIKNLMFIRTSGQVGGGVAGNVLLNGSIQDWNGNIGFFTSLWASGKLINIVFDNVMAYVPGSTDESDNSYTQFGLIADNGGLIENVVVRVNNIVGFFGIAAKNSAGGVIRNCIVDTNLPVNDGYPDRTFSYVVSAFANTNDGTIENCYSNAYTSNMWSWSGDSDKETTPLTKNGSGELVGCEQVKGYDNEKMLEFLSEKGVSENLKSLAQKIYS